MMRILIAVDNSSFSEGLLQAVINGIRSENAEASVLLVLEPVEPVPPPEMSQGYAPELEGEKPAARALVEQIASQLRNAGFAARTEVVIGDIADTILDKASEWRADLIAVGSHGKSSLHDLLLGSVADSIVRRAGCSVLVVRASACNKGTP
jgi:universal stress protein A